MPPSSSVEHHRTSSNKVCLNWEIQNGNCLCLQWGLCLQLETDWTFLLNLGKMLLLLLWRSVQPGKQSIRVLQGLYTPTCPKQSPKHVGSILAPVAAWEQHSSCFCSAGKPVLSLLTPCFWESVHIVFGADLNLYHLPHLAALCMSWHTCRGSCTVSIPGCSVRQP